MVIRNLFVLTALIPVFLCSCSVKQGLDKYPERQEVTDHMVTRAVESEIERAAKEKHVPPELSDDFVSRYIDIDSFDQLKQRTKDGLTAAYSSADMTEGEMALWKEIIDRESVPLFTTDDLVERVAQIHAAIDALAAEHSMTLEEYVGQTKYGMTAPDVEVFVTKQAEKFRVPEDTAAGSENILGAVPEGSMRGGFGSNSFANTGEEKNGSEAESTTHRLGSSEP